MGKNFTIQETGTPNLPQMMLATINALKEIGLSATIQELDEQVAKMEDITEEEQLFMQPNGRQPRFNYFLAWSRSYLKNGGALENPSRRIWTLTDEGKNVTSTKQTQTIYETVRAELNQRNKKKRVSEKLQQKHTSTPNDEEQPEFLDEDQDVAWRNELLDVVQEMDPGGFERLAQRLLREVGFTSVEVRGKPSDNGIDGVGVLVVNLLSFRVYFQCKRWKGSVGSKEIRDFRGALVGRADRGLFITTGSFTNSATEEATREGAPTVDLIDGERLCELLKDNKLGVQEKTTVLKDWFASV